MGLLPRVVDLPVIEDVGVFESPQLFADYPVLSVERKRSFQLFYRRGPFARFQKDSTQLESRVRLLFLCGRLAGGDCIIGLDPFIRYGSGGNPNLKIFTERVVSDIYASDRADKPASFVNEYTNRNIFELICLTDYIVTIGKCAEFTASLFNPWNRGLGTLYVTGYYDYFDLIAMLFVE